MIGINRHKPLRRRISRVPLSWSMIPAAMNKRRLESRVVHDVEDGGDLSQRSVEPDQQRDQPEMTDRGVRQQALQVLLKGREKGTQNKRDEAGGPHEPQPFIRPSHRRPKPHQEKNAGLYQRGRVQVRRHRRRRSHCVRQPEMKGELRAFCQRTKQNQDERWNVEGMGANNLAGCEYPVEVVAAHDVAQNQNAGKKTKTAGGSDRERHPRRVARLRRLIPIPDQEEGEEARQLPEEDQLDQVTRQHNAHHCAHEREQERKETGHRIRRRHVVACVENHQEADTRDQQDKNPCQSVQPEEKFEPKRRHPLSFKSKNPASDDKRESRDRQSRIDESYTTGQICFSVAGVSREENGETASRKRQRDGDDEERFVLQARSPMFWSFAIICIPARQQPRPSLPDRQDRK